MKSEKKDSERQTQAWDYDSSRGWGGYEKTVTSHREGGIDLKHR